MAVFNTGMIARNSSPRAIDCTWEYAHPHTAYNTPAALALPLSVLSAPDAELSAGALDAELSAGALDAGLSAGAANAELSAGASDAVLSAGAAAGVAAADLRAAVRFGAAPLVAGLPRRTAVKRRFAAVLRFVVGLRLPAFLILLVFAFDVMTSSFRGCFYPIRLVKSRRCASKIFPGRARDQVRRRNGFGRELVTPTVAADEPGALRRKLPLWPCQPRGKEAC
jgi:hypothetical protein